MHTRPTFPLPSRAAPVVLVVAPVLLLLSTVVQVSGDGLGADGPGGAAQVWAAAAMSLAVVVLAGLVALDRPGLAGGLTVAGLLGTAGAAGFGIDGMVYAADPTLAVSEQTSASAAFALLIPGPLFSLALAGLGGALAVSRRLPRPVALALVAGGLLFPVGRVPAIEPLALVTDVVLLVALVGAARHLARPEADVAARPEVRTVAA